MPSGSNPRPRLTRRSAPWLLATLTLALALAGPANADDFGGAEMPDPETVLATEVPELAAQLPPEAMGGVEVPSPAPPALSDPAPVAPEPPPPPEEPVPPAPAVPAEPAPDAEPVAEAPPAPPAVPLNLNVDIRILSPGDDGDVNQVINLGDAPSPGPSGGGAPSALGGLNWTWNWNWTWDCGGDCAGLLDDLDVGSMPEFPDRPDQLLEEFDSEAVGLPFGLDEDDEPLVAGSGTGEPPPKRAEGPGGVSSPVHGEALAVPALSPTIFTSNGAPSRQEAATAPARSPAAAAPKGDPERWPAGPPAQAMGLAAATGGGAGGGGGLTVLLLAALVGALALMPPPPGGRVHAVQKRLSSLLSSSRLERPG